MHSVRCLTPIVTIVILFILSPCQTFELREIRPWSARGVGAMRLTKRDMSVFELQSIETFLWGAEGQANLAFTEYTN